MWQLYLPQYEAFCVGLKWPVILTRSNELRSATVNFKNLTSLINFFNQFFIDLDFSENPIQDVLSHGGYFQPPHTLLCVLPLEQIHRFYCSFLCFLWSPALEVFSNSWMCFVLFCCFLLRNCEAFEYLGLCVASIYCIVTTPLPTVIAVYSRRSFSTQQALIKYWLISCQCVGGSKTIYQVWRKYMLLFSPIASEMLITLVSLIVPHKLFLSQQRAVNHWFYLLYFSL